MGRRHDVLTALRAAEGSMVSGELLAVDLGVSRAAVAKHVSALRRAGYGIDAVPGEGYRLTTSPEAAVPDEVSCLVSVDLWTCFLGGGPTASTNDDAKELARAGTPHGTVVLASEQTAGRGRLGRRWSSPPGGVYFSVVLRPAIAIADVPPLALVVALGVAKGLETLGVQPAVKWPNDLLLDVAKLAGILLETSAEADLAEWVVAGCGINVIRSGDAHESAAYLADAVVPAPSRAHVAAVALDGIAAAYEGFLAGGFGSLRAEYESRHALTGKSVTVRDAEGRELADGQVSRVDGSGRLVVETADGSVALAAGEVTLG